MDENTNNSANEAHTATDGHLKRKSHPSPIGESPGSPTIGTEAKRPKTSEFSDTSPPPRKNTEVTQFEFNDVLSTIFHVIRDLDKYKAIDTVAVSVVNGERVESSAQAIQSKLDEAQYSSIPAFKVGFK